MRLAASASFLLIVGAPVWPAERVDPHLLPASAHYTRNSGCAAVNIPMPPSTHSAVDENSISPRPVDMPLSQGEILICFAYATADMISQRVGTEISALDVATKYYFADPSRLAKSTNPDLRRHLRRMGDYRAVIAETRSETSISKEENPNEYPYIDKLEGGEEDISSLLYNIDGLCRDRDLPSFDGYTHFSKFLTRLRIKTQLFSSPSISFKSLAGAAPALRTHRTDAFNAAWLDYVESACRRRPLPVPLLPINYQIAESEADFMRQLKEGRPPSAAQNDRMFSMIDYALDHGRAPAVGYSWWVFEEPEPGEPDVEADHSSVIIARRKVGRTCQYKVQDNTGENCHRMREGVRERCAFGRIWLTEDEMKRTLYSVTYLR